jgi:hypothetical protein
MNAQTKIQYESDNESENTEQVFEETEEVEWDDNSVVAEEEPEEVEENEEEDAPAEKEGTATVGGMRTQYAERKAFVDTLGTLVNEAGKVSQLTPFVSALQNDPVYKRLLSSALRGERKEGGAVVAKAEDKTFKWCERCDTHIKKKGWAKHRRSVRCLQIFNSKKLAVNITNVVKAKEGRFAKTPIHPFYLVGQSLVGLLSQQKAKDADEMNAEWDAVRLPEQTQQLEDEVGTDESVYEPQEDFSGVIANVPAERNLTLAIISSAGATEVAPKVKKVRKSRAKKAVAFVEPEPEVVQEVVAEPEVVPEVVAEQPKKKRVYKKKPKAEVVAPAEVVAEVVAEPEPEVVPAENKIVVGKTVVIGEKKILIKKPKNKANPVIEPVVEVVAEATPEPVVEVVPEVPRRYVEEGIMDKRFYENFIRDNMSEKGQRLMDEIFGEEDADECENFVEYRVCSWGNPKDHICEYSELWFLDCETEAGYYYPVIVGEINTSSSYAGSRCGMGRDAEEDPDIMLTDEEIVALVKPRNHDKIRQILQSRRKDGK